MTEEEKKELVQDVVNQIKTDSQSVDELETVSTLDGVVSLPAMRGETVVSAPLKLLSKPAEDAAAIAKASAAVADASAKKADTAASTAEAAAKTATDAASKATDAAQKTNAAVAKAKSVEAEYKDTALAARNGATARFDGLVEGVEIRLVSCLQIDGVYYDTVNKSFCGKNGNIYCNNWPDADMYLNDVRTEVLKDKAYVCGGVVYVWSDEEENLVEISGSGGGNTYNVTEQVPLESGYYTLETAIAAVEEKKRGKGRCITFETAQGKWETKQFMGTSLSSWENAESWGDFGGGGKVKSVTLNGERCEPNEAGDISLRLDVPEVDASLDEASTNAIQNGVVATKLKELEAHTFGSIEVVPDGDDNYLYAYDTKGEAIGTPAKLPAGGGGGTSSASRILVTAKVAPALVKEGGSALLTWTYDHVNAEGESDGVNATVSISVKLGTTTLWTQELRNVSRGTYTADLSAYISVAGNVDVYVRAECTTAEGEKQTKQAYAMVTVVGIKLTSDYDMGTAIQKGGYEDGETISIPFTLTGSGRRTVSMYVDGNGVPTTKDVSKSGTTRDAFTIAANTLAAGRHTVQLVAERDGLKSDAIWIDLLKGGERNPWVGMKYVNKNGEVMLGEMPLRARLSAQQYERLEFEYAA